jgi:hypothetical protein
MRYGRFILSAFMSQKPKNELSFSILRIGNENFLAKLSGLPQISVRGLRPRMLSHMPGLCLGTISALRLPAPLGNVRHGGFSRTCGSYLDRWNYRCSAALLKQGSAGGSHYFRGTGYFSAPVGDSRRCLGRPAAEGNLQMAARSSVRPNPRRRKLLTGQPQLPHRKPLEPVQIAKLV